MRAWPLLPVAALTWPVMHGTLPKYADAVLGYDAILCLYACLLVTPVITVAKMPVSKLRWWYGNWVFALGLIGLNVHMTFGSGGPAEKIGGTPVIWTGTLIVCLLLPMAVTSSKAAQRVLGQEWKRWQRWLVWSVWALTGIHLALLQAWTSLAAYALAAVPLIAIRQPRVRKSIKEWRAAGYTSGLWWTILGVWGAMAFTGLAVLLAKEGDAIARAITGT